MKFFGVNDKNHQLLAVGYEPVDGVLGVRFKKGQGEHRGVPENVFESLKRVPFAYSYYTKVVKGKYSYTRIEDPPEEPNGSRGSNIQDVAGRDSNSGPSGDHQSGRHGRVDGCDALLSGRLHDSRCDAGSKGERVMEVFRPEDGMAFVETDPATGKPCHYYTLKDVRVPFSLTQVLELSGLARQPESASEIANRPAAAKRGTKIHEATLLMDQDDFDLESLAPWPDYYNRCLGWQQFREDFHFVPELASCEIPIGVRVNGMLYAMKLDAYGCIGEGEKLAMAVVEKKCSVSLESHYKYQTAGQAIAFREHSTALNLPLKRFVVQLLDKPNGNNRYYKAVEHDGKMDEKLFLAAGLTNVYTRLNDGLLKGI